MRSQMFGQVFDFGCENSDLDLWGTGIGIVGSELVDDRLFLLWCEHREKKRGGIQGSELIRFPRCRPV